MLEVNFITFVDWFIVSTSVHAPTEDIDEDEIYYLTNPMTTITKALKKANMEYLGLISKRPLTQEDMERIVELQTTITNYGVSGIFTYFY